MSANNFLHIRKRQRGDFIIESVDIDTLHKWKVDEAKTFLEARKKVKKILYERFYPVEYGVQYDDNCFDDYKL